MPAAPFAARPSARLTALSCVFFAFLALPEAIAAQGESAGGVEVTPDGGTEPNRAETSTYTTTFSVLNDGVFQYTFTLTCGRTGAVASCTNDLEQITLAAGASGNVPVQYTTGSPGSGTVTLTASRTGASDQGSVNVTVLAAGVVVPNLVRGNVDNVDRGLCLTVGAGEAAGLSCGDLFVVQGMPTYRSLGRDRSVSLYYNSASATGLTLLPAWFKLPHTIGRPTSIRVVLDVTGSGYKDSVTYSVPGSPICGAGCSDSFQVVSGKNLAWANLATGYYPVTLTFRSIYQTQTLSTVLNGSTLVFNRSASEYGRGWGLLGVEKLVIPTSPSDTTQRVWVAGDGSMRVYHRGAGLTSGQLSASGLTSFSAANSVDGNLTNTAWTTSSGTATTAYARADLGATFPQAVTSVRLNASTASNATYDVQYSTNGSSWTTVVAGFKPQAGWSSVVWSSVGPFRYWQVKVANNNGVSSTIRELSFGAALNFYGAPGDAPDSLVWYSSGGALWYRRDLKHGASVAFDPQGRHRTTTNRVGAQTVFGWDTLTNRLLTIAVPPDSGAARNYTFTWNGSFLLDSIRDPGGRGLKATITSGNLVKLRAPAKLDSTRFAYDGRNVLIKRIAVRQKNSTKGDSAVTTYTYANNARVTQIDIQADSAGTQNTSTVITPWDEHGLTTMEKVDTAGFATRIDGPLTGTYDAVDIRVDRFGQARRTNHVGLGTVTIVKRDSVNSLPALPAEVRSPHSATTGAVGMITRMSWDPRGNLAQQRDSSSHLGADSVPLKVMSYEYNDADAPDSPSRVSDVLGRHTDYAYNGMGLTDSIVDPRGHATRFVYDSVSKFKGTVTGITERSVKEWQQSTGTEVVNDQVTSFAYDLNGNTSRVTSPVGAVSAYVVDSLGRLTNMHGPDSSRVRVDFDALNRATRRVQYTTAQSHPAGNPLAGCVTAQVTCSASPWTLDSLSDTLVTRFVVSTVGVDSVIDPRGVDRSYRFDAMGRLVREVDDTNKAKIATYTTSGLLTSVQLRSGAVNTRLYDAFGRDTAILIPATNSNATPGDTVRTTYDLLGRKLVVRNRLGSITRTYFADGALKTQLVEWGTRGGNARDSLAFRYDATGARTRMYHAYDANPSVVDSIRYTYFGSGDLDSMIVTGLPGVPWTPSLGVLSDSEVPHGCTTAVQSGV